MDAKLQITKALVSVEWLYENLAAPNLIVLDATMDKITGINAVKPEKKQIKGARFFDIKHVFSDQNSSLPNTILSPEKFEEEAQKLGINTNSIIVVYDDKGIYSSPRVWWLFKCMGHTNVTVLNGGLPAWQKANFPIEKLKPNSNKKGNFKSNYKQELIYDTTKVLKTINDTTKSIVDARSNDRFIGLVDEPRKDLRAGHIPSSQNIPYTDLLVDGYMLEKEQLVSIFKDSYNKEKVIFSCGSGITACILALGAEIAGVQNMVIYDGSWTEWGSNHKLPIEK